MSSLLHPTRHGRLSSALLWAGFALLLVFIAQSRTASATGLSMESILSAPYPSGLVGSPTSGAVAWVYNDRGARNVWVAGQADACGEDVRPVTAYAGDGGLAIASLRWAGDGRRLVYVRGGDGGGRTPTNPLSLPEGVRGGEIWSVDLCSRAPVRLAAGVAPSPSPDGKRVAYIAAGQPWLVASDGSGEPVQLWSDRGAVAGLSWSEDGRRIAFVSRRSPHSLIGVFDLEARRVTWLAPGADIDSNPVWSPDGSRIAFLRSPSDRTQRMLSEREGHPWEIWTADVATGEGHSVWHASPGVGSRLRRLFNSDSSLFWTAENELVFPWEVTGWVRLYAVDAGGGEARLLTPGESEVFGAQLSGDRTRLVYASNQGDIDRRHIWELSTTGAAARQLTRSEGIEDFPVLAADDSLYALRGDARLPLRPVAIRDGEMSDLAPQAVPADFPADRLVVPELVSFDAPDGVRVSGQLFLPTGHEGPRPAILFFHGGPTNRQAFASWDSFDTHSNLYAVNQYLASNGFIVLSVNYRGGAGYGFEFRAPPDFGSGGAGELKDIIGAAEYLAARPDVDAERLGVWGGSYGGRMASLALARAPQYFKAGVDYAGVHNITTMPGFTGLDDDATRLAWESSAIAGAGNWRAPVLFIHPDADAAVPIGQTAELAAALRDRGLAPEIIVMPDETHFLLRHASWISVGNQVNAFLSRHLDP